MARHLLTLENLQQLDGGRICEAFNQAIKRAAVDCIDRPGETKERKVNLQIGIKPIMEDDGDATTVKYAFEVKDTIPTRKSKVYEASLQRNGTLIFNDMSDDAADQTTFSSFDEE